MKVALICDDLIQHGGAEKIVEAISEMFPKAPIYTTVATKEWRSYFEKRGVRVVSSFLQKFPFSVKLNRHYSVFGLHIFAIESFDFSSYDLIFSLSSRYAHFAITKPQTKHICYLNTPGRMFWEPFDYFEKESLGVPRFLKKIGHFLILPYLSFARVADYAAMRGPDKIISNSRITKNRLIKYFGLESTVIHPFTPIPSKTAVNGKDNFYLVLTRLVSWKRVDIAVRACEKLGRKLIVAGDGPDMKRLQSLSDGTTKFLGRVLDGRKWELLANCSALINTQKEDFGIVPLEAMAAGKPVVAYSAGGALETVVENKTGLFFKEQNVESLCETVKKFEKMTFSSDTCRERAGNFSFDKFKCSILEQVDELICTQS